MPRQSDAQNRANFLFEDSAAAWMPRPRRGAPAGTDRTPFYLARPAYVFGLRDFLH